MLFPLFLETDPKLDKQDIIFHFLKDISKACLNHTYFVILILRNSLCCELYLFDLTHDVFIMVFLKSDVPLIQENIKVFILPIKTKNIYSNIIDC